MQEEPIMERVKKELQSIKGISGGAGLKRTNAGEWVDGIRYGAAVLWYKARKISVPKVLLIWTLTIIAGVFLFKFMNKGLPGMSSDLVFASWWEDSLEEQSLSKLVTEFEKQNPGITVKLEKMSWEKIRELLERSDFVQTQKTTRNAREQSVPDIFSIDPHAIGEMERRSYLAALENKDAFSGNALPLISFINPLFYNIDLLKAAGFDRPPKNRTEFLSYAQRLKETGKETGVNGAGLALGDPRSTGTQLLSWIWPAAGSPGPEESFNFNSEEVITTLNFLNQLKPNLYGNPFELSEPELLDAFGQGKVGMMIGSIADIKKLKTMNVNFGITTIPDSESYARKPVFPLTVWYVGINSRSVHQEAARKFIAFLRERTENIAVTAYAIPANGSRNRELSKNDPYYAKSFDMYEASDKVRELYVTDVGRFYRVVHSQVELLFRGDKAPEQCAEAIQQGWKIAGTRTP